MKPASPTARIMLIFLTWPAFLFMAFVFWFIDLFAKSYDLPGAHIAGIFVLCTITVAGGTLLGLAMRWIFKDPFSPILKSLLLLPPLIGFLFVIWDVNWCPVYIAALSLPVSTIVLAPKRIPITIAILFAFGIVTLLIVSELPQLRFQRYAKQFRNGCWCCGYRQRAMRELCYFGEKGYDVIAKAIEGDEGQTYNTSMEIYSDKDYEPLEIWFSETHPTMLRNRN